MKSMKRLLSGLIWSLVALCMAAVLSIQLPPVQSWLGRKAATMLSKTLGTDVTVGRVEVGLFNRIIIDNVCIPDLQGDTLLRAGRLSVKASLLPLFEGRVDITSAQLFSAHVRLYQPGAGETGSRGAAEPNWQFVVDALTSKDDTTTSSPLNLRIRSLIVRHSSVSYDRGDAFTTPGRFNPNHLALSDISTHILLKSLTPDSLSINLKRLSMREQSGLSVEDFTARLAAGPNAAQLYGMRLQLPHSTLTIDTLDATYNVAGAELDRRDSLHLAGTKPDKRFLETLRFRANIEAIATLADLSPLFSHSDTLFRPSALATLPAVSLAASLQGTAKSLDVKRVQVMSLQRDSLADGGLVVEVSGHVQKREDGKLRGNVQLDELNVSAPMLSKLEEAFPVLPDELSRLGGLHASGQARYGHDDTAEAEADLATAAGGASMAFAIDEGDNLSGHVATDSLHLGRLLANDDLGTVAGTVTLGGTRQQLEADADISHLHFKGHRYTDIQASGSYQPKSGDVTAHVKAPVVRLHPSGLGLTAERDDAFFSANVEADVNIQGVKGENRGMSGFVRIDDFTMRTTSDSTLCHIGHLELTTENEGDEQRITLNSDVATGELTGQLDLASLPHSLRRYVASKLPTLPGLDTSTPRLPTSSNDFNLSLTVWDTQWMKPLLGVPLTLRQPLRLIAAINDDEQSVNLSGRLPSFDYSGSRYADLLVSITTLGDSALCDATLTKLNSDGGSLALTANIHAANNRLTSSLAWQDTPAAGENALRTTKGVVNALTKFYTDDNGRPVADIGIQPSLLTVGDKAWNILPCRLTYSDERLDVDNFVVRHDAQHLIVDGRASKLHTDTLTVDMEGLDIAYIQDLLDFHPVDFAGLLGGKAKATAIFGNFGAWADIVARDFRFMNGRMGTLAAQVKWNAEDKQIDIDATADEGVGSERWEDTPTASLTSHPSPLTTHPQQHPQQHPSPRTVIQGYVSPVREDIDLKIHAEGSNIEFVHTFAESFMRDVSGRAYGEVELSGPLGNMNLTGKLTADGQVTIDALNTTYRLEHDTVYFVHNDIQFRGATITDRDGHTATLNGGIHHQWLSDFTFDLDVETSNTLVYDFPAFDDGNICGTVRVSGHADMHGRPGEVIINCDVTPQAGSTFAYNAANPDAVSRQEFIKWGSSLPAAPRGEGVATHSADGLEAESNLSSPSGEALGSSLFINFLINATPEATLKVLMDAKTNDYITLNGEGTIRAAFHDKGPFHMFGTYTVSRGTYGITIQDIIKKNFTFQPEGTVIFGGDPFEASLNLQAVHTVNGVSLSDLNLGSSFASNTVRVNCLMNITGTPSQPRVEFDLDMPTVNSEENQMIRSLIASEQEMNQQVLYLLGIGRFYTQGANNADAQQYGQTTLAMQSFLSGTVSTQINEVLSQVIKSNDWNFGANISTGDEGWNNAEYEGMVSGRLLNNRLLINGQFGYRDNATTTTPSFIGDFDLQYLLNRNGNLAVKVYNQTNDRYFTRSALNTQGVGLVMKKDFDGLSELLRRKKKTKNNRKFGE